jgi:hypothetical protein
MLDRNVNSIAGFPTNYQGVRDLLYLNEGNGPNGRAHFKDVGVEAGLESSHFSHGLGSVFTDVNGDGRPDLYVANDEDPNQLYVNKQGGALGFHFVDEARAYGVADPNAGMGVAEGDYNGDSRTPRTRAPRSPRARRGTPRRWRSSGRRSTGSRPSAGVTRSWT